MGLARVVPSGENTSLLLEREAQVAALQAFAAAARESGGRFVVIEGSAGIGKTRLLAEARAMADAAEMRVLAARGGELEGEFAYGIVRQLFEPLLASARGDLRAELLSGPAALSEPLFGVSHVAGSHDAPRRARSRSSTDSTGSRRTPPFNSRPSSRSTICTGPTRPPCGGSIT
jgi:AAA ATPase domain